MIPITWHFSPKFQSYFAEFLNENSFISFSLFNQFTSVGLKYSLLLCLIYSNSRYLIVCFLNSLIKQLEYTNSIFNFFLEISFYIFLFNMLNIKFDFVIDIEVPGVYRASHCFLHLDTT